MSNHTPPWRIGSVRYLNAVPLIFGHDQELLLAHPSVLASDLHTRRLDAALVPVFEVLNHPGYCIVDGVGIISDGAVYSVFLATLPGETALRHIALDPASLTSVNLIRVICKERGMSIETFTEALPDSLPATGRGVLFIGDQALEFRRRWGDQFSYLDLGEAWKSLTGLPFVYAAWALGSWVEEAEALAEMLRAWGRNGVSAIPQIVEQQAASQRREAQAYLGGHIRYAMGAREREGLALYGALLEKHGRINEKPQFSFV